MPRGLVSSGGSRRLCLAGLLRGHDGRLRMRRMVKRHLLASMWLRAVASYALSAAVYRDAVISLAASAASYHGDSVAHRLARRYWR